MNLLVNYIADHIKRTAKSKKVDRDLHHHSNQVKKISWKRKDHHLHHDSNDHVLYKTDTEDSVKERFSKKMSTYKIIRKNDETDKIKVYEKDYGVPKRTPYAKTPDSVIMEASEESPSRQFGLSFKNKIRNLPLSPNLHLDEED